MKHWFKSFLDHRLFFLLLPAAAVLMSDRPVFYSLLFSISAILFIVGVGHWLRQMQMHYISMGELAGKAKETSIGAAIVFFATAAYSAVLVMCTVWWVRG
jgi:hypothetical protein